MSSPYLDKEPRSELQMIVQSARSAVKAGNANGFYAAIAKQADTIDTLVSALKLCRQELYDDWHSHMSQEQFENDPTIRQIDAALSLASGKGV